jgi:hypothetical protein
MLLGFASGKRRRRPFLLLAMRLMLGKPYMLVVWQWEDIGDWSCLQGSFAGIFWGDFCRESCGVVLRWFLAVR